MKISSLASLLLPISLLACSSGDDAGDADDADGSGVDCGSLLAGDLVITEIMANPAGEDRGSEYFEIYNASSEAIDLDGLTLVYSLADGSNEKTHDVDDLVIEPGDYLVLGTAEADALRDYMDYGFGNDLGSLRNAGAALALRCDETEIDRTEYPSAEGQDGVASILDGEGTPDFIANDDVENYCSATTEFSPGLFGSPGEANESCNPIVGGGGTCLEGDGERDIVVPEVGDLVITEFMASPEGSDDTNEWFEIYATTDVDLNGLTAGRTSDDLASLVDGEDCLRLAAGQYAVFAKSAVEGENGGVADVVAEFNFALVPAGSIVLGVGEAVLDEIAWTSVANGASTALDPAQLDPTANDDEANWVTCAAEYGDAELGNRGTPGASNDACGGGPIGDTCNDGGTDRDAVRPVVGDLVITEFMASPDGSDDTNEWFEVLALQPVDLQGLVAGRTADAMVALVSGSGLRPRQRRRVRRVRQVGRERRQRRAACGHRRVQLRSRPGRLDLPRHRGRRARRGDLDGGHREHGDRAQSHPARPGFERRRGQLDRLRRRALRRPGADQLRHARRGERRLPPLRALTDEPSPGRPRRGACRARRLVHPAHLRLRQRRRRPG